ncbi:hypothetical protein BCF44_12619 [Kutzneria buriramensis]|uniref:Winged helix DNA-binding protein n=1 Tax=Kutzneria buriramensis TaxID=1045776 RepID=A0A3E0GW95_9PSEU|nr:hypothetical protein [Kutzneria buriramensis]REH28577.1 hypothetical protein BCF44_12619 [Kutzneria buriramensis]
MGLDVEPLSRRALNMLRAVAAGRGRLTLSCELDLYVDGLPCCDQITARSLTRAGLIAPGQPGRLGESVPAVLTPDGSAAVADARLSVAS